MFSVSDFLAVSLYHRRKKKKKRGNKHCARMIDHVLNFIRLLQVLYIRSSKINNQEIKPTLFNCYITKLSQKKN